MITTKGKSIVAKYLVNQAPGYAGYLAIGCGANPLSTVSRAVSLANVSAGTATITTATAHSFKAGDKIYISGIDGAYDGSYTIATVPNTTAFTITGSTATANVDPVINGTVTFNYVDKKSLNFEMFRIPIVSRGIITENNTTKVIFSGELPTAERYGMTEIGIYPSGSNPTASGIDSRILFNFSNTENWEYHSDIIEIPEDKTAGVGDSTGNISATTSQSLLINSSDPIFDVSSRLNANEQPRFETKTILVRGNACTIDSSAGAGSFWSVTNGDHIHHTDVQFNFDKNSADDEIKIAFSILPNTQTATVFSNMTFKAIIQFTSSENVTGGEHADIQISLDNTALTTTNGNSRYYVITTKLKDLVRTENFNWSEVNTIKIYPSVEISGTPNANYWVAFDALRFENITSAEANPLYGLTGYSILSKSSANLPVIKESNTNNLIEFKFSLDAGGT